MTTVVRYALSFDGLATKVNHHQTVSDTSRRRVALHAGEGRTQEDPRRSGFDRLIRLGIGLEDADDLIAALNWALHHADAVTPEAVSAWQAARVAALGVASQP